MLKKLKRVLKNKEKKCSWTTLQSSFPIHVDAKKNEDSLARTKEKLALKR